MKQKKLHLSCFILIKSLQICFILHPSLVSLFAEVVSVSEGRGSGAPVN